MPRRRKRGSRRDINGIKQRRSSHNLAYFWLQKHLPNDRGRGPAVIVDDTVPAERARYMADIARMVCLAKGEDVPVEEFLECVPAARGIHEICGTLTHELAH